MNERLTRPRSADIKKLLMDKALILVLMMMIVVIIIIEPAFFQWRVMKDILTQSAVKLICALGLMFPLLLGGTDLAGGRQVGLAAVIVASLSQTATYVNRFYPNLPNLPIFLPILITLAVVAVIGLCNGLMIAKLKMAPFIATYGMSTIVYGINLIYTNAQPIGGFHQNFKDFFNLKLAIGGKGFSAYILFAVLFGLLFWFLYNKTTHGKYMYAIGGNENAAEVSGVNVRKKLTTIYMIAGMMYAFAGFLMTGKSGGASASMGTSYELEAIAGCTIGGVSTTGGIGTVSGILVGVLVFELLKIILQFLGVDPNFNYIVQGLVVITAVAMDIRKYVAKK